LVEPSYPAFLRAVVVRWHLNVPSVQFLSLGVQEAKYVTSHREVVAGPSVLVVDPTL
jgi:hypothetical protein